MPVAPDSPEPQLVLLQPRPDIVELVDQKLRGLVARTVVDAGELRDTLLDIRVQAGSEWPWER